MADQLPKILDVRKIKVVSSPQEKTKLKEQTNNAQFWKEPPKQKEALSTKQHSRALFIWLYSLLLIMAFALAVMTTILINNKRSQTQSRQTSETGSYSPQSEPGEKNPFEDTQGTEIKPEPTPTPVPEPTPEPELTIDKKSIRLRVLNGNGIAGSAAKIKTQLTQAGFVVSSIGNTKQFSYETTQIYYITNKQKEAELVDQALSDRETTQTEAAASVVGDDTDVLVVVGKK